MKSDVELAYEFVEYIPEELKERILYISIKYATAVHKCCCGCGREVVTPLAPTSWQLSFDGTSVSLYPSIGSWSLPCRSHYFITRNRVKWAPQWTKEQIANGRAQEAKAKERYFAETQAPEAVPSATPPPNAKPEEGFWKKIMRWLSQFRES
jgi:hypothetical protein